MPTRRGRVPVIDITDLYHPPQDPGDNFDLVAAYALPAVDLRAVVFDVTERFRKPVAAPPGEVYQDDQGPRDPGFISVLQLNALFGRDVPCGCAPFTPLRAPEDPARDAPPFQQRGIERILEVLRTTSEPVHVVSFGSARPLAVAFNREPELLRAKVARVHLCAGAAPAGYLEWNVMLDPAAFVRILRCDLPVAIYPCATATGPFDLGPHNTYWELPDLGFVRDLDPGLRRYLVHAFGRSARSDFLRALEEDPPAASLQALATRRHHVWETAVWTQVAGLALVRRADGSHRLVARDEARPDDAVVEDRLVPCRVEAGDDGQFRFDLLPPGAPTTKWIYHRPAPQAQQAALQEALPALYRGFHPEGRWAKARS